MKVDDKQKRVSHVSFFLKYGRWPHPQINHTCDTPECVRITHIYEGTQKQNMDDMIARGRAKFREPQLYEVGGRRMSLNQMADHAQVSVTCIQHRLKRGLKGKDLITRSHAGPRS